MSTKARYGIKGPVVTLREFVNLQGGETNWKNWDVLPYCQYDICRGKMQPYDVKGAVTGSYYGGRKKEMDRPVERRSIGFQHIKGAAHAKCPANYANDPRFNFLTEYDYTSKDREANKVALMKPDIRQGNRAVLDYLMHRLTGQPMGKDEREQLGQIAEEQYELRGLKQHPWVLAYRIALLTDPQRRVSARNGVPYYSVYQSVGEQLLPYLDARREAETNRVLRRQRNIVMPQQIHLSFFDQWTGQITPQRDGRTHQIISFNISKNAWRAIASKAKRPRSPQQRLNLRRRPLAKTAS